jgi:bifunctional DNA-binding transcriptional regulator/antitoxin component of YhaV-PrlF toxin-antitoxin module
VVGKTVGGKDARCHSDIEGTGDHPKEVREALRLEVGDRVSFLVRADGVAEMRPETVELRELVGSLAMEGKRLTVEGMNEIIRRAASKP